MNSVFLGGGVKNVFGVPVFLFVCFLLVCCSLLVYQHVSSCVYVKYVFHIYKQLSIMCKRALPLCFFNGGLKGGRGV